MSIARILPAAAVTVFCMTGVALAQPPTPTAPATQPTQAQPNATPRTQQPTPATQPTPTTAPPGTTQPGVTQPTTTPPGTPSSPMTQGTSASTGTTSIADTEHGTAILLLERVQKVLDKAADDYKDGQVSIERGLLDEVRAEIAKVKDSLQAEKR